MSLDDFGGKPKDLTPAQWQLLTYAYLERQDHLSWYGVYERTRAILRAKGLIELRCQHDAAQQAEMNREIDTYAKEAQHILTMNPADWEDAYVLLKRAHALQEQQTVTGYFLTPAALQLMQKHGVARQTTKQ